MSGLTECALDTAPDAFSSFFPSGAIPNPAVHTSVEGGYGIDAPIVPYDPEGGHMVHWDVGNWGDPALTEAQAIAQAQAQAPTYHKHGGLRQHIFHPALGAGGIAKTVVSEVSGADGTAVSSAGATVSVSDATSATDFSGPSVPADAVQVAASDPSFAGDWISPSTAESVHIGGLGGGLHDQAIDASVGMSDVGAGQSVFSRGRVPGSGDSGVSYRSQMGTIDVGSGDSGVSYRSPMGTIDSSSGTGAPASLEMIDLNADTGTDIPTVIENQSVTSH